jgi:hypothetical protein
MLRTLALPMAIAFALLLFLLYPVVRFKTYPGTGGALPISGFRAGNGRYRLSAFSGVVEGTSRRATETTHTTRDEQGALLDSYTVTTVYDGLVLVDAQGNTRAFEVADFHVVTRPGHSVTVVSAARGRGGEELFVAVLDRTTRTGYFRYQSWGLFLGPGRMLGSMFLACVVGVPLAFGTAGVGLAIPFIAAVVMRIFTKRNIKRFRKQLMATT